MNPLSAQIKEIEQAHAGRPLRSISHSNLCSRTVIDKLMADISYIEHKLRQIDQKRLPNKLMRNNYLKMLKDREDVLTGLRKHKDLKIVPKKVEAKK